MLLKMQNPMPCCGRAWWPGGRTTQNAFAATPFITASTAFSTPPTARSATSSECGPIAVSPVLRSCRPLAMVKSCMTPSSRVMNSIDEIIEIYKRDVDVTLIDEALKRTVEERLRALEEFEEFREELHAAVDWTRDPAG